MFAFQWYVTFHAAHVQNFIETSLPIACKTDSKYKFQWKNSEMSFLNTWNFFHAQIACILKVLWKYWHQLQQHFIEKKQQIQSTVQTANMDNICFSLLKRTVYQMLPIFLLLHFTFEIQPNILFYRKMRCFVPRYSNGEFFFSLSMSYALYCVNQDACLSNKHIVFSFFFFLFFTEVKVWCAMSDSSVKSFEIDISSHRIMRISKWCPLTFASMR